MSPADYPHRAALCSRTPGAETFVILIDQDGEPNADLIAALREALDQRGHVVIASRCKAALERLMAVAEDMAAEIPAPAIH